MQHLMNPKDNLQIKQSKPAKYPSGRELRRRHYERPKKSSVISVIKGL
jgi:hypothetical protein